jgi:adenylylsulfate kinase
MNEKIKLFKTVTWRITASTTTLIIVYILSGEIKTAGAFTFIEIIIKTIIYYLHETFWDKVTQKN